MKSYEVKVSGTHCQSCKIYLEDILSKQDKLSNVEVNLRKNSLRFTTSSKSSLTDIINNLTAVIKPNGYSLYIDEERTETADSKTSIPAILIGLTALTIFYLLQKSGVLNFSFNGSISPLTSFTIGLIASVSSCLAVVGGLVLSLSTNIANNDNNYTKIFTIFHIGRIITFALLGGLLGGIGAALTISFTATAVIGLFTALIILLLGLNMLGFLRKFRYTISPVVFNKIRNNTAAPLAVGAATFFLPCGFTQAMQLSALSSGSFLSGLLTMLFFALGTLPVLAVLSFGSASFINSKYRGVFLKAAGIFVVGLGLISVISSLTALGVINPLLSL